MARVYANWLGKLDIDQAIKDIKNSKTVDEGFGILQLLTQDAFYGIGSISDNDAKNLIKAYKAYGTKYNLDVSNVTKNITYYLENNIALDDEKDPKIMTELERIRPDNMIQEGNKTTTRPMGEYGPAPTNNNNKNNGTGSTGSGTTSNKTPTTGGTTSTKTPSSNTNTTTTKTETPVEKPVYEGADAVAKRHGIDYNLENTLADYNQRTNDYYDAATAEYEADRTRYVQASNNYANRIMDEYLDSYANATATAAGRGATAAAALMTDLNTQSVNAANDLGMLQTINNLNEARKAELVKNKYLAEQYYNDLGTYLSQVSTAQYGADVNKYVKAMDAYAQQYAADRALAENEARAASTKYAGLANASAYKSSQASSTAAWDRLYNYYLTRFNGNEAMASNAVINNLGTQKAGDK